MQQMCRQKNKHTNTNSTSVWILYTGTVKSQHQRKQEGKYQNGENKSKSTAPNNAIKKNTKRETVNGTKYYYKTKALLMLLKKFM
jgi:hypothetical protein